MAAGLRFGPLGPNAVHLCVAMQTLFAEGLPSTFPGLSACCRP
jgi:hypothetical protein